MDTKSQIKTKMVLNFTKTIDILYVICNYIELHAIINRSN